MLLRGRIATAMDQYSEEQEWVQCHLTHRRECVEEIGFVFHFIFANGNSG